MARNFNFTESRDNQYRASSHIEFRVDVWQLAWACAHVANEEYNDNPRLVPKHKMEKRMREELLDHGNQAFRWMENVMPEVEELWSDSIDHVKEIYGVND